MARTYQANCSFQLQDATLENLKILAQIGGSSVNKTVNQILSDYVEKFSAEIAELKHATQTATFKLKEKIFGENVKKISIKRLPTNDGARLAAILGDQIIVAIKIEKVDEEKAMQFVQNAIVTIASNFCSYEITRADRKINLTVGDTLLSQEFEDARTAEKVEAFLDEIFAQISKQAFQNKGN